MAGLESRARNGCRLQRECGGDWPRVHAFIGFMGGGLHGVAEPRQQGAKTLRRA